ncbi:MAG: hypothetical protein ABIQ13_06320, partial [Pedococcus sp.]
MSSVQSAPEEDGSVSSGDGATTPPDGQRAASGTTRRGRVDGLVEVRHWPIPVLMLVDVAILVIILVLLAMSRYEQKASIVNREGLGL